MRTVADMIDEVRVAAGSAWRHGDAVTTWARPFGTDLLKAWTSCPRGDFLATLAPLVGVRASALHREVQALAREMVDLSPSHRESFEAIADLVDHGLRGAPMPRDILRHHQRVVSDLRQSEDDDATREIRVQADFQRSLGDLIERAHAEASALPSSERAEAVRSLVFARFEGVREVESVRSLYRARNRRAAAALALRTLVTALSFSRAVESGFAHDEELAPTGVSRFERGRAKRQARLAARGARLCAIAAETVQHANLAKAWSVGAVESAWLCGMDALATHVAARATSDHGPSSPEAAWSEFERAAHLSLVSFGAASLSRSAENLREAFAVDPIALSDAATDRAVDALPSPMGAPLPTERDSIRELLQDLSDLAFRVRSSELHDALGVALALVDSDGPLDRTKLAKVMVTVHARFVDVIRDGAAELGGDEGERWQAVGDTVEARFSQTVEGLAAEWAMGDPMD